MTENINREGDYGVNIARFLNLKNFIEFKNVTYSFVIDFKSEATLNTVYSG